jgi:hypothetical protein
MAAADIYKTESTRKAVWIDDLFWQCSHFQAL